MPALPFRALALVSTLIAGPVFAQAPGAVTVRYDHPEDFTETREVRAFAPAQADQGYLDTLKAYIEKRAARVLAPDQHLEIVVTDVDRAGSYLPSTGAHPLRIVEPVYPPRIHLHFRLLDGQGQVIREGDRKLTNLAFMYESSTGPGQTDPLRYEKRLIDHWLAKGVAGL